MAPAPLLHISDGTRFGYRTGLPWSRQSRCLVETAQEITTGPGLHLLVAPNGTGKTTLLRTLAGLSRPLTGTLKTQGCVHYFADELKADPEIKARTFFRAWFRSAALAQAEKLAEILRLDLNTQIGKLSRGNRQKVLLILAEIKAARSQGSVLLMDEPLTGLDAETRTQVTQLWAETGRTTVRLIIMHELECVQQADSLLTIAHGKLKHATTRTGDSWMKTYQTLQS
ncbi:ATP-binding cassette domain-containing protein [Prosthecobacter dejongeii]|uniref:ABC-2 type transport system ATP-binding protein/manganese/iron transport system ATP-binding protein n=1 Tax=Prosthecobacter dejongeii TaxID=48465 RepID=A0A7W8DNK1_9BACT|nr:ATP-binding cassette domain-containing protein [Prosthecobacter dejongeii]MBB5036006.1 ABC-2 type transport system ATP-binding protein/manganese/iron transport system ATP-binding protein [Prosthecobacter dejongeii]